MSPKVMQRQNGVARISETRRQLHVQQKIIVHQGAVIPKNIQRASSQQSILRMNSTPQLSKEYPQNSQTEALAMPECDAQGLKCAASVIAGLSAGKVAAFLAKMKPDEQSACAAFYHCVAREFPGLWPIQKVGSGIWPAETQ